MIATDLGSLYTQLAKVFMALMDIPQPWVLSVAHTEWSLGLTRINILLLGVVKNGVAIPLLLRTLRARNNVKNPKDSLAVRKSYKCKHS